MTARDWQILVDRGAGALAERDARYYATFVRGELTLPESVKEGYRAQAAVVLRAAYLLPADPLRP